MKKSLVGACTVLAVALSLFTAAPIAAATTPKSVCIDPGHGGTDSGTSNTGGVGQILEKDLNLQVALLVGDLLRGGGYGVSFTRTADLTLSNKQRAQFCNGTGANILVSIHHNGSSDHAVDYSQALYQKRADIPLAKAVVGQVSMLASASGGGTMTNKGTTQFASGVLLFSDMPATISEGFFLTNDDEYKLLTATGSTRRQDEAQKIYEGIVVYLAAH